MKVNVRVKKMHPNAKIPEYKTAGAAGFDLHSVEEVAIPPGDYKKVSLGLAFEIPEGYEIQIRPRSGMSFSTPLIAKNTIGTIDSDYRGEVSYCLYNSGKTTCKIKAGERVCQGILKEIDIAVFTETQNLSETVRGENGFGSTGRE